MIITLDLPPDVEAALLADAQAQGRSTEAVVLERLAAFYEGSEPEAVEAVAQALADLDTGDRGILLDEYIAQVKAGRQARDEAKAAAA